MLIGSNCRRNLALLLTQCTALPVNSSLRRGKTASMAARVPEKRKNYEAPEQCARPSNSSTMRSLSRDRFMPSLETQESNLTSTQKRKMEKTFRVRESLRFHAKCVQSNIVRDDLRVGRNFCFLFQSFFFCLPFSNKALVETARQDSPPPLVL